MRFAHEIVGWNGFSEKQRELVWQRLLELRDGAVRSAVDIIDAGRLAEAARAYRIDDAELSPGNLIYEVLRCSRNVPDLALLGLRSRGTADTVAELYQHIEQELLTRSQAHYERNFHVPVG